MKDTPLDFPLSWMRTFINLALMHSTATSPLSIPATIDSPTAKPTPWFPFFSYFPPSAPEQNTTYTAAVKALCPLRLTSCNHMTSQPVSSQVFSITSTWPMLFVPLKASVRTLYVPTTSSPRPSPCICANFVSSPSNPPASPPFFPSLRFPPFHPPLFPDRVFPPLRLPLPSPVLA